MFLKPVKSLNSLDMWFSCVIQLHHKHATLLSCMNAVLYVRESPLQLKYDYNILGNAMKHFNFPLTSLYALTTCT